MVSETEGGQTSGSRGGRTCWCGVGRGTCTHLQEPASEGGHVTLEIIFCTQSILKRNNMPAALFFNLRHVPFLKPRDIGSPE